MWRMTKRGNDEVQKKKTQSSVLLGQPLCHLDSNMDVAGTCLVLHTALFASATLSPVRVSVPEEYSVILDCSGHSHEVTAHTEWTHRDNKVIVTRDGDLVKNIDHDKHALWSNGSLLIKDLEPTDSGEYHCNEHLVADVEVLRGQNYHISAGRTLLLPCKGSENQKQTWKFKKENLPKRQIISVKYKNGTVKKEIDDPQNRFAQTDNELKISNLQPMDAGEYLCNKEMVALLTVKTETSDTEESDSQPGHVVTTTLIGLSILVISAALVGLFLWTTKKIYKRNQGKKLDDLELQSPSRSGLGGQIGKEQDSFLEKGRDTRDASPEDSEIHYASLGHQNWRERPRVQDAESHIIYSTVAGAVGQIPD